MAIELDTPISVTREVTELRTQTYGSTWITRLEVAGGPAVSTSVRATFVPWEPTTNEYDDRPENSRELVIGDLFGEAQSDPELAEITSKLIAVLARKAKEKGVI